MLDPIRLWPFLLTVAFVELTPGPNMGYLALVASRDGRRAGFATVAGVTLGLAAYLAATLVGLTDLLLVWPTAYGILRWAGVAYLVWLAIDTWRGADGASIGAEAAGGWTLFRRGLIANLLNPKAALFYVALLPSFIEPARGHPDRQALALGLIHIAASVAVHSAIVLAAAGARPVLRRWQAGRPDLLQRVLAVGLLGVAGWLALSTGR